MAELEKLIAGETLIGPIEEGVIRKDGKYEKVPSTQLLFYGNVIYNSETGKTFHIKDVEIYYRYLDEFLNSPNGQKYERPTKEEIDAAITACIGLNKSNEISASVDEDIKSKINQPEQTDAEKEETQEKPRKRLIGKKQSRKKKKELQLASDTDTEPEPETDTIQELESEFDIKPIENELSTYAETEVNSKSIIPEDPQAPALSHEGQTESVLEERVAKLTKQLKRVRTMATILLLIAIAPVFLYQFGYLQLGQQFKTAADEIRVIALAKDIKAGDVINEADLEEAAIMREQFEDLSAGTAVDSKGNAVKDYVQLWSNRNGIIGKYAADNLVAGEYLMASDYATLKNGLNMIEIDIDGTKVKVPVKATAAGTSDMRLYAIVTSRSAEGLTNSFALNLGELTFEGKSLKDILTSDGTSVLKEVLQN